MLLQRIDCIFVTCNFYPNLSHYLIVPLPIINPATEDVPLNNTLPQYSRPLRIREPSPPMMRYQPHTEHIQQTHGPIDIRHHHPLPDLAQLARNAILIPQLQVPHARFHRPTQIVHIQTGTIHIPQRHRQFDDLLALLPILCLQPAVSLIIISINSRIDFSQSADACG
jgi:hypothetical protein